MNRKKKAEATKKKAVRVDPDEHEEIIDEINRREVLEHEEEDSDEEEDGEKEDGSEDGEDEEDGEEGA